MICLLLQVYHPYCQEHKTQFPLRPVMRLTSGSGRGGDSNPVIGASDNLIVGVGRRNQQPSTTRAPRQTAVLWERCAREHLHPLPTLSICRFTGLYYMVILGKYQIQNYFLNIHPIYEQLILKFLIQNSHRKLFDSVFFSFKHFIIHYKYV